MKILQLIQVANWFAVYDMQDGNGPVAKTLACVALIEDVDGMQKIVGFDGGEKFLRADVQPNFLGYYHASELGETMLEEVND